MRIRAIRIENFRAIRYLELKDLPNAIVVAGPNGCGKSSLFDAIRLLKSAYGQYHQSEYQLWFQEF
jgi:AAA15 family ATPase/GTPase